MKKLSSFASLLGICMLIACSNEKVCRINGTMRGMEGQDSVYVLRSTGEFTRDTVMQAEINNGHFKMELPQELWGEKYDLKIGNQRFSLSFFAEQGDIEITGNIDSLYLAKVKGTPDNDRWTAYQQFNTELAQEGNRLRAALNAEQLPDSVKRAKNASLFQALEKRSMHYEDSVANSDPKSVFGLYLYYSKMWKWKYNEMDEILAKFPELKNNRYYKEMQAKADVLRKIAPGAIAPDFKVKTVDGGEISLSSFRGNYVILDFWASWCAPCRAATECIKDVYKKYNAQGLEVFSVSLDDNKEAWLKAIKEDGMTWKQGCQLLKGGKYTPVAQLYGIDGIPAFWVIDPEGKILCQETKGDQVVAFCEELFSKK